MNKSYIASTICVSLLLLMLGVVCYFVIGARRAASELSSDIRVSIFLSGDITASQRRAIEEKLSQDASVEKFDYLSSEAATEDFEKNTGIAVKSILRDNPIPSSFEVDPISAEQAEQIEQRAASWEGVTSTMYPKDISKELLKKSNAINSIIIGVAIMMLVVSLSLIYYTLKLSVMASADTIRTMQLVGAAPSFIKRPYVRRASVQGLVSALLGGALFVLLLQVMDMAIPELTFDIHWAELGMIISAMILLGITINTLFTAIALRIIVK